MNAGESRMATGLQGATVAAFVLAVLAMAVPDPGGHGLGVAVVVLLVAAPLLRVVGLVVRWWSEGDRRFVLVGIGLLAIVGVGAIIASLH